MKHEKATFSLKGCRKKCEVWFLDSRTTIAKWQGRWCYRTAGLVIRHENPDFNIIIGGWDGMEELQL